MAKTLIILKPHTKNAVRSTLFTEQSITDTNANIDAQVTSILSAGKLVDGVTAVSHYSLFDNTGAFVSENMRIDNVRKVIRNDAIGQRYDAEVFANSANPVAYILPTDVESIRFVNTGAGLLTITAATGDAINDGATTVATGKSITLTYLPSANIWYTAAKT